MAVQRARDPWDEIGAGYQRLEAERQRWLPRLERIYREKVADDRSWFLWSVQTDFLQKLETERQRQEGALKLQTLQETAATERTQMTQAGAMQRVERGAELETAAKEAEVSRIENTWRDFATTRGLAVPTTSGGETFMREYAKAEREDAAALKSQKGVDAFYDKIGFPDFKGVPLERTASIINDRTLSPQAPAVTTEVQKHAMLLDEIKAIEARHKPTYGVTIVPEGPDKERIKYLRKQAARITGLSAATRANIEAAAKVLGKDADDAAIEKWLNEQEPPLTLEGT